MNFRVEGDDVVFEVIRTERIRMTQATRDFIRTTCERSGKIPAIKFVRAEHNLGLKEAKDIVDGLVDNCVTSLGQLLRDKLDRIS